MSLTITHRLSTGVVRAHADHAEELNAEKNRPWPVPTMTNKNKQRNGLRTAVYEQRFKNSMPVHGDVSHNISLYYEPIVLAPYPLARYPEVRFFPGVRTAT